MDTPFPLLGSGKKVSEFMNAISNLNLFPENIVS